jgi:hypothetical protein
MRNLLLLAAVLLVLPAGLAGASAQPVCEEGEVRPCGSNIGACAAGSRTCANGSWGDCLGQVGPEPELCGNGLDENCNSQTDECAVSPWIGFIGAGALVLLFIWILSRFI